MSITQAVQAMLGENKITGLMYGCGQRYYYDAAGREYLIETSGDYIRVWLADQHYMDFQNTEANMDKMEAALEDAMSDMYKQKYP